MRAPRQTLVLGLRKPVPQVYGAVSFRALLAEPVESHSKDLVPRGLLVQLLAQSGILRRQSDNTSIRRDGFALCHRERPKERGCGLNGAPLRRNNGEPEIHARPVLLEGEGPSLQVRPIQRNALRDPTVHDLGAGPPDGETRAAIPLIRCSTASRAAKASPPIAARHTIPMTKIGTRVHPDGERGSLRKKRGGSINCEPESARLTGVVGCGLELAVGGRFGSGGGSAMGDHWPFGLGCGSASFFGKVGPRRNGSSWNS